MNDKSEDLKELEVKESFLQYRDILYLAFVAYWHIVVALCGMAGMATNCDDANYTNVVTITLSYDTVQIVLIKYGNCHCYCHIVC